MNIWKNNKLFFWTIEILVVILIAWFMFSPLNFVLKPIGVLFAGVFIPVLISGFLYYVFNPILNYLERKIKIPRILGAIIAILLVILGYIGIAFTLIPAVISQLTNLVNSTIHAYPYVQKWAEDLLRSNEFKSISKQVNIQSLVSNLNISYTDMLKNLLDGVTLSFNSVVGIVVQMLFIMLFVPIFLYYMLKDGHKLIPFLKNNVLHEDKYGILDLLKTLNTTLSKYIFGLAVNVLVAFVALFIGYLIIGMPYAFLFALLGGIMVLVPYLGPWIASVPVALAVVFTHPWLALIAVIYMVVVHQINGSFIFPKIVSGAINMHPVTVMVLMFVMGMLYGVLGMIIAVPLYAIVKEVVKFLVALRRNIRLQRQVIKKQ